MFNNILRIRSRSAIASCCFFIAMSAMPISAFANDKAISIVKFMDVPAKIQEGSIGQFEALVNDEPEVAAINLKAFKLFDQEEFAKRMSVVFERYLTNEDIKNFNAFMVTPVGLKVRKIFRDQNSPEGMIHAVNKLPNAERKLTETFLSSKAMASVVVALNSREAKEVGGLYTEYLVCRYVRESEPENFHKLTDAGKCIEITE